MTFPVDTRSNTQSKMLPKMFCCNLKTGVITYGFVMMTLALLTLIGNIALLSRAELREEYRVASFQIGGACVQLVATTLLIYGAIKESKYFLMPFIVLQFLGLALTSYLCVMVIIQRPVLVLMIPIMLIFWYLWYSVVCYFRILKDGCQSPVNKQEVFVEAPPAYTEKSQNHA